MSPGDEPDEEFDRLWVQNLIQAAFERLKRESPPGDGASPFKLLRSYLQGNGTYEELAASQRMTESQVRTSLEVARRKLRKLVQEAMGEYMLSAEDFEAERVFVSRYLE